MLGVQWNRRVGVKMLISVAGVTNQVIRSSCNSLSVDQIEEETSMEFEVVWEAKII